MNHKIEMILSNEGDINYKFTSNYYGVGKGIIEAILDSGICKTKKQAALIATKAAFPKIHFKK